MILLLPSHPFPSFCKTRMRLSKIFGRRSFENEVAVATTTPLRMPIFWRLCQQCMPITGRLCCPGVFLSFSESSFPVFYPACPTFTEETRKTTTMISGLLCRNETQKDARRRRRGQQRLRRRGCAPMDVTWTRRALQRALQGDDSQSARSLRNMFGCV